MSNRALSKRRWAGVLATAAVTLASLAGSAGATEPSSSDQPDAPTAGEIQVASSLLANNPDLTPESALAMVRASAQGSEVVERAKLALGSSYAGAFIDIETGTVTIGTTEPGSTAGVSPSVSGDEITAVREVAASLNVDESAAIARAVNEIVLTTGAAINVGSDPVTGGIQLASSTDSDELDRATVELVQDVVAELGGTSEARELPAEDFGDASPTGWCYNHTCDWPAAGVKIKVQKTGATPFSQYDCTAGPIAQNIAPGALYGHWFATTAGHCMPWTNGQNNSYPVTISSGSPVTNTFAIFYSGNGPETSYTGGSSLPSSVKYYESEYAIDYAAYDVTWNQTGNVSLGMSTGVDDLGVQQPGQYGQPGAMGSHGGVWLGSLATLPPAGSLICNQGAMIWAKNANRQWCGIYWGNPNVSTLNYGWYSTGTVPAPKGFGVQFNRYWAGQLWTVPGSPARNYLKNCTGDSGGPVTWVDSGGVVRVVGIVSVGSMGGPGSDGNGCYNSTGMVRVTDMFGNMNVDTGMNLVFYYHPCAYTPGCTP